MVDYMTWTSWTVTWPSSSIFRPANFYIFPWLHPAILRAYTQFCAQGSSQWQQAWGRGPERQLLPKQNFILWKCLVQALIPRLYPGRLQIKLRPLNSTCVEAFDVASDRVSCIRGWVVSWHFSEILMSMIVSWCFQYWVWFIHALYRFLVTDSWTHSKS